MKGQLAVKTPEQYIARLEDVRRTDVARLDRLIHEVAPQLDRCIISGVLAYGPVHYRYASGREGDAARLAIASNASAISLYVLAANEDGWVAPRYRAKLPKAKIGKSCIRFKRLDDLDLDTLRALIGEAASTPFPAHGGEVTELHCAPQRSASAGKPGARKRTSTRRAGRSVRR